MDDLAIQMGRYAASGYCCSQVLALLALDLQGVENPGWVRAMAGLCNGMGDCEQVCGALSGGQCVLAHYAGKGADHEEPHDRWQLMASELADWFAGEVCAGGGIRCRDVRGDLGADDECVEPGPDARERCGNVVRAVWVRCLELLAENNIDPTEPVQGPDGVV